jgi:hypothetical protein
MVSRLGRQFKRADLAIGLGSNLQPCGGRLRHEVVQPDEGRCRGPRGSLALLTEDVQHRAELAQGLLARLLDGEEELRVCSGISSFRWSATPDCTLIRER